jgi:hypothetical protein
MIITITHENKEDKYWRDCSVRIPDCASIHEIIEAVADCIVGTSFAKETVMAGFDGYLECNGYYEDDEEDDDDTETN